MVGDFDTSLSVTDRIEQEIVTNIEDVNNIINNLT